MKRIELIKMLKATTSLVDVYAVKQEIIDHLEDKKKKGVEN